MNKKFIDEKLQEITKKIVGEFHPEKIILFGSWAWGTPGPDSDVDLLVVQKTPGSTRKMAEEISGSIFPRPFPLDIIVYSPERFEERIQLGDFFVQKILNEGYLLYAK